MTQNPNGFSVKQILDSYTLTQESKICLTDNSIGFCVIEKSMINSKNQFIQKDHLMV